MIPVHTEDRVLALLAQGLSRRKVAALAGVSRTTVDMLAKIGRRRSRPQDALEMSFPPTLTSQRERDRHAQRCLTCGARVVLPCVACAARAAPQTPHRLPELDEPELEIDLDGERQRRYCSIKRSGATPDATAEESSPEAPTSDESAAGRDRGDLIRQHTPRLIHAAEVVLPQPESQAHPPAQVGSQDLDAA